MRQNVVDGRLGFFRRDVVRLDIVFDFGERVGEVSCGFVVQTSDMELLDAVLVREALHDSVIVGVEADAAAVRDGGHVFPGFFPEVLRNFVVVLVELGAVAGVGHVSGDNIDEEHEGRYAEHEDAVDGPAGDFVGPFWRCGVHDVCFLSCFRILEVGRLWTGTVLLQKLPQVCGWRALL